MLANLGFLVLCLFLGALIGFSPIPGAVLTGGLGMALLLFVVPVRLALWTCLVVCFVLVGPAESLGRVPRVFWLSYLLGLFLLAKAGLTWAGGLSAGYWVASPRRVPAHSILLWIVLITVFLFGSIAEEISLVEFMLGSRDYLWLWGFAVLVLASRISTQEQAQWIRLLQWIVILQLPLVIYQHFFVIGISRFASHDAVVGLFGGNPEGGGASGAMGFFSLLMALYAIGRQRTGQGSRLFGITVVGGALLSIALAEVKFVAIAAPLVALVYFGPSQVLRSPKALVWIAIFAIASPAILYGYWRAFEAPGAKGYGSFERYLSLIVERNTDTRHIDLQSGEMGRIAAIRFWKDQSDFQKSPLTVAFGHGVGASRIGVFAGHLAQKYRFRIARSSLTVLLWEFGVVGTAYVVLLLLAGWRAATNLTRRMRDQSGEMQAISRLISAVFATALIGLPYNTDLVGTPQFQLLMVLSVAWLVAARKEYRSDMPELSARVGWQVVARTS